MAKDKTQYTEDSIQSLDPRSHVRLRPGMYVGSTENPNHLLMEVFANALDEHNIGHGNQINVNILDNGTVQCEDMGQGFPINVLREEDGKTVLEASFSVTNTSGKFSDDGVYGGSSLGLNGLGGKLCNFLSEWFEVISHDNKGKYEHLWFKDGLFQKREIGDGFNWSGTTVTYKPDKQFFDTDKTDVKFFEEFFNDICCLCPNLTVRLNNKKINHPRGIEEILPRKLGNNIEIINNPMTLFAERGKNKLDFALTFTGSSSSTIIPYVNYGITDAGPHVTAIKSTITRIFNSWAKENGLLGAKDKNLDGNSIQEGMLLVCNIVTTNVAYDAQVKSRVSKMDTSWLTEILSEELELWLDNNPEDAKIIIEKALLARKAAEAAKKAREKVKAGTKAANKKVKIMNPDKLKDAEHLGQDSILLCVEGLSAGSTIAVARDPQKYGILMLRGKLINALTNDEKKFYNNEEVQLLLKALNVTPDGYNPAKLRYGRVGICVDSDSDGYNIGLLIMTALYKICPEFIQEKRLCWLRSPLYIVKDGKNEQYFFTDQEMNAARGQIKGEVQRNKGLGSLSAEQAKNSMFGESQHLDVLEPSYNALLLLEDLMGNSVEKRKEFIFDNIDFREVRE